MLTDQPKDLTGDAVYDYLKNAFQVSGLKLVGANVVDKKVVGPKDPRKIISLIFEDEKTGNHKIVNFNYNKIHRRLQDG